MPRGEDLLHGGALWLPAGAAYFCEPTPCRTNTNGLASGNDLAEATLHGLLEVIERDAVARLVDGEHLDVARSCEVLDPGSITAPELAATISAIERARTKVVLLRLRSGVSLPVVWAVLLNREPFASSSTFNTGFGAALDVRGAVARAVSEAVQSRLTMIHGARDDIVAKPAYREWPDPQQVLNSSAYRFFDGLQPGARLDDSGLDHGPGVHEFLQIVLARLREAGHERVYRVDLCCPVEGFSVVKIIAPSLRFDSALC
jgi:ribosomal protein S12 methylthiotransferase accessory factor